MAERTNMEKQKIIHILQQVPFADKEKEQWISSLNDNGVTEELLDELHEKLLAIPTDKFASEWMRAKFSTDLVQFTRQWRMGNARRQFKHGR